MWDIVNKELRDFLYNPRFLISFAVAALLIFLSVYTGFTAYKAELANADAAEAMSLQEAEKSETYQYIKLDLIRRPDLLSIFDFGLNSVIGREGRVETNDNKPSSVSDSRSEESPVYALFKELDLTRTLSFVLTLIAILFAHSMISGEKEHGTLKLLSSYPLKRSSLIIAKFLGGFLPLALLFLVPVLMSLLGLMLLADVNFTAGQFISLGLMLLANLLCLLIFFSAGLAASSMTRSSFMSLLTCLIFWVLAVAVVPRAAAQFAQMNTPSMPVFEKNQMLREINKNINNKYSILMADKINKAKISMDQWRDMFQDLHNQVDKEMKKMALEQSGGIYGEYLRKRKKLLETVENYSRISPVSSMQHIVHRFTGAGPDQLERFEQDLDRYVKELSLYSQAQYKAHFDEEKNKTGGSTGVAMTEDEKGFLKIIKTVGYDQSKVNLSNMPRFQLSPPDWKTALAGSLADFAILAFYSIIFILMAVVAFMRYDVR